MPPEEFIVVMTLLLSGIGLVFFLAVPIRKAIVRKIEGRPSSDEEHRWEEVEFLRRRVEELEERQDFAERLLGQHRDAAELPPGGLR